LGPGTQSFCVAPYFKLSGYLRCIAAKGIQPELNNFDLFLTLSELGSCCPSPTVFALHAKPIEDEAEGTGTNSPSHQEVQA